MIKQEIRQLSSRWLNGALMYPGEYVFTWGQGAMGLAVVVDTGEGSTMTHVMLDLETWGTRPGCALRSIGAVAFDPNGGPIFSPTYYQNIDQHSFFGTGLTIDPKTEQWWSEQSAEAQLALASYPIGLEAAVYLFSEWWAHVGATAVWCHGASFDAPIYEAAALAVGLGVPWAYNAVRDTRTLYMLADFDPKSVPFEGTKHNALTDAINQAQGVQLAASKLRGVMGRIR